jgi:hypothetical protein
MKHLNINGGGPISKAGRAPVRAIFLPDKIPAAISGQAPRH